MMSRRIRFIALPALIVVLAATGWVLQARVTSAPAQKTTDPAFERLRTRDGEQNPLVIGDDIAGSADMWRSSRERTELERQALAGNVSAAFELSDYYTFTTDDRAEGHLWLERAARGGHEVAQFNLAVELGASNCSEAKRKLKEIADRTTDAGTRDGALSWIHDPSLCMTKGPTD